MITIDKGVLETLLKVAETFAPDDKTDPVWGAITKAQELLVTADDGIPLSELKFGPTYLAEVAWKDANPIHRCIVSGFSDHHHPHCTIWAPGYDAPMQVRIDRVRYLKVLRKIDDMGFTGDMVADRLKEGA